jgi:hypothetical protein
VYIGIFTRDFRSPLQPSMHRGVVVVTLSVEAGVQTDSAGLMGPRENRAHGPESGLRYPRNVGETHVAETELEQEWTLFPEEV